MGYLMKKFLFFVLMLSTSVSWSAKLSIENYSRKPVQVNNIGGSVDIVTPNGTNSDFVVPAIQYNSEGEFDPNKVELKLDLNKQITEYALTVSGCLITIKTAFYFDQTVAVTKGSQASCRQVATSDFVIATMMTSRLPTSKTNAEIIIFEDAEKVTAELEELDSQYAENVENLTQKLEIYAGSMQSKISDEIVSKLNKDNEALGSIVQETFDSTVSADKLIEATQSAAQSIKTDHQNAVLDANEFYIEGIKFDEENQFFDITAMAGQAVLLCGESYNQYPLVVDMKDKSAKYISSALLSAYLSNSQVSVEVTHVPPTEEQPAHCAIKSVKVE